MYIYIVCTLTLLGSFLGISFRVIFELRLSHSLKAVWDPKGEDKNGTDDIKLSRFKFGIGCN